MEFLHGRTQKSVITIPEEWEKLVDMSTITVHLTEVGAPQGLVVKRVQGREVHLQTKVLPVDCYYMIMADLLDTEGEV